MNDLPGLKPNRVNNAINKQSKSNADKIKHRSGNDTIRSQKLNIVQLRVHQY